MKVKVGDRVSVKFPDESIHDGHVSEVHLDDEEEHRHFLFFTTKPGNIYGAYFDEIVQLNGKVTE